MAHCADRAHTHCAIEDVVVLWLETRSVDDVSVCCDELNDRLNGLLGVAEFTKRHWDGLVHDLHRSTTDQLLELNKCQIRLDTGGIAIHHQTDGASWSKY